MPRLPSCTDSSSVQPLYLPSSSTKNEIKHIITILWGVQGNSSFRWPLYILQFSEHAQVNWYGTSIQLSEWYVTSLSWSRRVGVRGGRFGLSIMWLGEVFVSIGGVADWVCCCGATYSNPPIHPPNQPINPPTHPPIHLLTHPPIHPKSPAS